MTDPDRLTFTKDRVDEMMRILELMAAGDTNSRLTISDHHDELDAIAHAVNVLAGELGWTAARMLEAQDARAAAAERADAAKTVFIRNMSHEIRTPIAAMISFADLLLSADAARARPDFLQRLKANGKAVVSLLDDLLDLAKLDADRVVLNPEPVLLVDLVGDVLASVEVDSRAKGLEMRVERSGDRLGAIVSDRFRLRQILVNLVGNAVKFTKAGGVTVIVQTTRAADGAQCTIDVVDTGIGIAPNHQARLFEPFEQADVRISRTYGGSGLGLSLSRRLAHRLGGQLELLRSGPGEGSTFRLSLTSLPELTTVGADGADARPDEAAAGLAGLRILLAEDHRDLHTALREKLEQAGATVSSAYNGRDAVEQAQAAAFDAVLMDLRMPHVDGLQATRELRRKGYAAPILALTADPAALWRASALEAGCDDCLSKPFMIDHLFASILNARPRFRRS
jgi:signal transduction histidine kinase/ActR/RegA family two-component response regulator